jgi:hypothetical protein
MRIDRRLGVASLSIALAALAACSTGGQRLTRSGFLDDYDSLVREQDHRNIALYVAPGFSAASYDHVILEPIQWRAPERPDTVKTELEKAFRDRLVKSLSGRFTVVDDAGAAGGRDGVEPSHTLRIRAAITNSRRASWYANVAAQAVSGYGAVMRPSAGGASEEIEVLDAGSGRRVLAIATYYNGQFWDVAGSYLEFGHARAAFSHGARALRRALDDAGGAG